LPDLCRFVAQSRLYKCVERFFSAQFKGQIMENEITEIIIKGKRVIDLIKTINSTEELIIQKDSTQWDLYADKILKLDEETFEKFRNKNSLELDLFRDQFKTNYEILDGIANTRDYFENFDVLDIYFKTSNGVEKFIPKES
jgi:hypothetical protein